MIRNVKVKAVLVNRVFPIFTIINRIIPKNQNKILIYTANDALKDNSKAVYDYLISNQYHKKYKIVCCTKIQKNMLSETEQKTIKIGRGYKAVKFRPRFLGVIYFMTAGHVLYSEGKIPIKPTQKQKVINMWHGIPVKKIGLLSNLHNGNEFFFTYVCASSEFYRPIMAKAFGCPEENVCICGEPKTDRLYTLKTKKQGSIKLVVWAPTFRQSSYLGYNDSLMPTFLPFIENSEWEELNEAVKNRNIKLLVKLHGAQDLHGFQEKILSNLEIYGDVAFRKRGLNLYDLLAESDALIADYSSVYLHYLLLDRPIGFALGDIDEYRNTRGFVFDNPLDYMPGEKLYSKSELYSFMDKIVQGIDDYAKERQRVCNKIHMYNDGKNCERVLKIAGITI